MLLNKNWQEKSRHTIDNSVLEKSDQKYYFLQSVEPFFSNFLLIKFFVNVLLYYELTFEEYF